jgi:hypothetical protein
VRPKEAVERKKRNFKYFRISIAVIQNKVYGIWERIT